MDWLMALSFWHWWILGLLLLVIEMLAPGVFFMWIGIAAGAVGLVSWLAPGIGWEWQFLLFAVFSVSSIGGFLKFRSRNPIRTDQPDLNRRGEQYIGRNFILEQAIENGTGKILADGVHWRVQGEDAASGTTVKVTAADGVILKVQATAGSGKSEPESER